MVETAEIAKKLKIEFFNISDLWIVFVNTTAEKMSDVSTAAIKMWTEKGYTAIILSANRPCDNLLDLYERNGINTSKTIILDCVCRSHNVQTKDNSKVIHIESSVALTELSIAINDVLESINGKKVLFIDSITTMLIDNDPSTFAKFIHNTLIKLRMHDASAFLVALENESDNQIRSQIAQLCDKVFTV